MSGFAVGYDVAFGPDGYREKKPNRKMKNLIQLGIKPNMAYARGRTRMGGWAVACSPILGTTITLSRLGKRGYISLLSYYLEITHG